MKSYLYVIGIVGQTPVKLGHTTDLGERLKTLQTAQPFTLEVRAAYYGNRDVERLAHAWFSRYRVRGEWFDFGDLDPVQEVADFVQRVHGAAASLTPASTDTRSERSNRKPPKRAQNKPLAWWMERVLHAVRAQEGRGVRPLAAAINAHPQQVTRALAQLELDGLVYVIGTSWYPVTQN